MKILDEIQFDSFFARVDQGELILKKTKMVSLTIKIHPDLLEQIDLHIEGVRFRSRGHFIGCAVADFIELGPELKPRKNFPYPEKVKNE